MPSNRPASRRTEESLLAELGRACLQWLASAPEPGAKAYHRMREVAVRVSAQLKEGKSYGGR